MFCLRKRGNAPQLINAADREGLLAENHITLLIGRSLGRVGGWVGGWVRLQNRYHDSVRRKTRGRFLCQVNASVGEILDIWVEFLICN